MNTIVQTIPADEYALIEDGVKNFILHKSKVTPQVGQRLLLVSDSLDGKEVMTKVSYVESGPGLFKGHFIVQFLAPVEDKVIDMTGVVIDRTGVDWSKEELSKIDTTGMKPGSVIQNNEGKPDIIVS